MATEQKDSTAFEAAELHSHFECVPEANLCLGFPAGSAYNLFVRESSHVAKMRVSLGKMGVSMSQLEEDSKAFSGMMVALFSGKKYSSSDVVTCLMRSPEKVEISRCTLLHNSPELWIEKSILLKCLAQKVSASPMELFDIVYSIACAGRSAWVRGETEFSVPINLLNDKRRPISTNVFNFYLKRSSRRNDARILLKDITAYALFTGTLQPKI